MSLNIKNEETVRLVQASWPTKLDVSMTAAITDAVRARLDEIRSEPTTRSTLTAQRILADRGGTAARGLGADYASAGTSTPCCTTRWGCPR